MVADYDVVIIGAGVIGCHTARQLSRYKLKICLMEKQSDVASGATSANSGIVHSGYDAEPGTLKARFNVRGNKMMDRVARELDVPFRRIGSLVLAFNPDDMTKIKMLYDRGLENGVQGMEILSASQLRKKEPNVSQETIGALYAPGAGIICPYELAISAAENAVENGVDLVLECEVKNINVEVISPGGGCSESKISHRNKRPLLDRHRVFYDNDRPLYSIITNKGEFKARCVVNCAGLYADAVASMVGDTSFSVSPRKGEYILFDKRQGGIVSSVIFRTPTRMGKGILVTPTVDGNLLIGPNAVDTGNKSDVSTTGHGLEQVLKEALKSVPGIDKRNIITSFTGIRAVPSTGDFIIGESKAAKGFINAAGIESPGLTAAPAIAEYIEEVLRCAGLELVPKPDFNPARRPVKRFRDVGEQELADLIKGNPFYGRIVCRCEKVSAAEIVDAIRRPAGARTLDGIKRRTRAGMGRCQGGFCTPRVMEILSNELGIPLDKIAKSGKGSWMLAGRTK